MADIDAAWTGGMPYADFLNAAIDDGIEGLRLRYPDPADARRAGGMAGLEACRDRDPGALLALLREAEAEGRARMRDRAPDRWYWRWRARQVERTLNVVEAARWAYGIPASRPPTHRGLVEAARILGIAA